MFLITRHQSQYLVPHYRCYNFTGALNERALAAFANYTQQEVLVGYMNSDIVLRSFENKTFYEWCIGVNERNEEEWGWHTYDPRFSGQSKDKCDGAITTTSPARFITYYTIQAQLSPDGEWQVINYDTVPACAYDVVIERSSHDDHIKFGFSSLDEGISALNLVRKAGYNNGLTYKYRLVRVTVAETTKPLGIL